MIIGLKSIRKEMIEELIALIKGFAHGMLIPLGIFWMSLNAFNNIQGSTMLMLGYLMFATCAYDFFTHKGEWLRSQKWYYLFVVANATIIFINYNFA